MPLTTAEVEQGMHRVFARIEPILSALSIPFFLASLAYALWLGWSYRVPPVQARHRAEALAFQLVTPPREKPPMEVAVSAAVSRGQVAAVAPPAFALRQAMDFDDAMVLEESTRRVGDFDLCLAWLHLPGEQQHWLVTGWVEEGDLEVLNLRFACDGPELSDEERQWGERILARVLVPSNFTAGPFPVTRLRLPSRGAALPLLGPSTRN